MTIKIRRRAREGEGPGSELLALAQSGSNRDYVLATVHALEALGLRDRELHLPGPRS